MTLSHSVRIPINDIYRVGLSADGVGCRDCGGGWRVEGVLGSLYNQKNRCVRICASSSLSLPLGVCVYVRLPLPPSPSRFLRSRTRYERPHKSPSFRASPAPLPLPSPPDQSLTCSHDGPAARAVVAGLVRNRALGRRQGARRHRHRDESTSVAEGRGGEGEERGRELVVSIYCLLELNSCH